jgi:hypothetical protein
MLTQTSSFNGSLAFDTVAPFVGFIDYPLTTIGAGYGADFTEGVTFTVTLYGSTRTYMPTKAGSLNGVTPGSANGLVALCLRYD